MYIMTFKVYLAGPEVFLPNAKEMLAVKADLVREAGFIPISPGDLEIPKADTRFEHGLNISAVDEKMMLEADAIIANLTPFRGVAADTGTTFELGFMCGQGKHVFAYTNVKSNHFNRLMEQCDNSALPDDTGRYRADDGIAIENCDMIDNLMLHGGVIRRGGSVVVGDAPADEIYTDLRAFKECLALAKKKLLATD